MRSSDEKGGRKKEANLKGKRERERALCGFWSGCVSARPYLVRYFSVSYSQLEQRRLPATRSETCLPSNSISVHLVRNVN